jgi:hypothetical protein
LLDGEGFRRWATGKRGFPACELLVPALGVGMPEAVRIPDPRIADLAVVVVSLLYEILVRRDQRAAFRKFSDLNNARDFPFYNDRPVYISTNLLYKIRENITLSSQWFFGSGKPITLPQQKFTFDGFDDVLFLFSDKNSYRMGPVHRLDIGFSFNKKKKLGIRSWNIGVINLYNNKNPYYYDISVYKSRETHGYVTDVTQWSFFPITPSVSYRFAFR